MGRPAAERTFDRELLADAGMLAGALGRFERTLGRVRESAPASLDVQRAIDELMQIPNLTMLRDALEHADEWVPGRTRSKEYRKLVGFEVLGGDEFVVVGVTVTAPNGTHEQLLLPVPGTWNIVSSIMAGLVERGLNDDPG